MYNPRQNTESSKQVHIACYIALEEMEHIKLFKCLYIYVQIISNIMPELRSHGNLLTS